MFDHLEFTAANIEAARRFYKPICRAIGAEEAFFDEEDKSAGFGSTDIVHLLLTEGPPTTPTLHICFAAENKQAVEKAYADALSGGGADNGKPGYREHYGQGYFAAFVLDPDGHNVEILYRDSGTTATT